MKIILSLGGNPERLNTAIPLLQANPGSHLVISSESPIPTILDKLNSAGVNPSQYTIDETAWDTVTNFTNTMPLVKKLGATELMVVTDGFHMLRSMCVARLIYFKSGTTLSAHPSSPENRNESIGLVLSDTLRAAISRFFGCTVYYQGVYNERIPSFYNDYYAARSAGAPVSPS
jgi:uncharacterized SAM-binding protein YcdF (DUF218 family)